VKFCFFRFVSKSQLKHSSHPPFSHLRSPAKMSSDDIFIISITLALLVSSIIIVLLLLADRLRRNEPFSIQSNLEINLPPTPSFSDRLFSNEHYQSILDLPSSYFQEQDGKDGQEVCEFCLFPVDPGVPIKTIPACKHFFHGMFYTSFNFLVDCIAKMICNNRFGSCKCCCPLCRSPIIAGVSDADVY
jgi:hypothetical protein